MVRNKIYENREFIGIRLHKNIKDKIRAEAKKRRRSISAFLIDIFLKYIAESTNYPEYK